MPRRRRSARGKSSDKGGATRQLLLPSLHAHNLLQELAYGSSQCFVGILQFWSPLSLVFVEGLLAGDSTPNNGLFPKIQCGRGLLSYAARKAPTCGFNSRKSAPLSASSRRGLSDLIAASDVRENTKAYFRT